MIRNRIASWIPWRALCCLTLAALGGVLPILSYAKSEQSSQPAPTSPQDSHFVEPKFPNNQFGKLNKSAFQLLKVGKLSAALKIVELAVQRDSAHLKSKPLLIIPYLGLLAKLCSETSGLDRKALFQTITKAKYSTNKYTTKELQAILLGVNQCMYSINSRDWKGADARNKILEGLPWYQQLLTKVPATKHDVQMGKISMTITPPKTMLQLAEATFVKGKGTQEELEACAFDSFVGVDRDVTVALVQQHDKERILRSRNNARRFIERARAGGPIPIRIGTDEATARYNCIAGFEGLTCERQKEKGRAQTFRGFCRDQELLVVITGAKTLDEKQWLKYLDYLTLRMFRSDGVPDPRPTGRDNATLGWVEDEVEEALRQWKRTRMLKEKEASAPNSRIEQCRPN